MRVLVAFDKFKHAVSAREACDLAASALRRVRRDWQIDRCPLTDGGEGFQEIVGGALRGNPVPVQVTGPRGGWIQARFTLAPGTALPAPARRLLAPWLPARAEGPVAVVEMASASGLHLLDPALRNPWDTSTHGTGQLIRAAAEAGARLVLLGIGGSATNDLGTGALSALGFDFRLGSGEKIRPPVPRSWNRIGRIDGEPFASLPPVVIASDVTNPLLGPDGATRVFGPQKGLRPEEIPSLEAACGEMARRLCESCRRPLSLAEMPGTGAAGGLAFGLRCALGAPGIPGFELVSACLDLEARLDAADLVLTGEGCFDRTSLRGKGPGELLRRAVALGKPVLLFPGQARIPAPPGTALHPLCADPVAPSPEQLARTGSDLAARIQAVVAAL